MTQIVTHPAPDVIEIHGANWLEFLHRIATANLIDMPAHSARRSLLTNALGRIIDLIWVLRLQEDGLLVTSPGRGEVVVSWLQQYIFFQDDVHMQHAGQPARLMGAYAADAIERLSAGLALEPPTADEVASAAGWLSWNVSRPLPGMLALSIGGESQDAADQLPASTAASRDYLRLQLQAGWADPLAYAEHDANPLEAGWLEYIAFDKGCYIGQEVIARLDSRGQTGRSRWLIELETQPPARANVTHNGNRVGVLVEAVPAEAGGWLGLALLRSKTIDEPPVPVLCLPESEDDEGNDAAGTARPIAGDVP